MSQALPLQPGSQFRGLLIHSQLGSGGMGTAYLASHPVLHIPLVVKIFNVTAEKDIFGEAHLAARVTSPYTTSVLDAGVEGNLAYMVQSYVDGVDIQELSQHLHQMQQNLPFAMLVRILLHAAYGLHAIHQAGVIHRDIKPANLFLRGSGITMVGDFGIATAQKKAATIMGTPLFMAPEQLRNEPITRSTDLYALGVTAHFLATGILPFADMIDKLHQAYAPPVTTTPRMAYLFAVIERMLRQQPGERYQTAAAVATELARIAEPGVSYVQLATNRFQIAHLVIALSVGDLAKTQANVLVSASNWSLVMDSGVSKALRKVGGTAIEQAAIAQGPAAMGQVIWTGAGDLQAQYVAHAVAALKGAICIQRCTLRVLLGAEERQAHTVAFPALGTGIGDVPMELAAQLMLEAIRTFANLEPKHVQHIAIVLYDQQAYHTWLDILTSL